IGRLPGCGLDQWFLAPTEVALCNSAYFPRSQHASVNKIIAGDSRAEMSGPLAPVEKCRLIRNSAAPRLIPVVLDQPLVPQREIDEIAGDQSPRHRGPQ